MADKEKLLEWIASSYKDLMALPVDVRRRFGYALSLAQMGDQDDAAKVLKGFGGAGVLEVVENDAGGTYRAVYTVTCLFGGAGGFLAKVLELASKPARCGAVTLACMNFHRSPLLRLQQACRPSRTILALGASLCCALVAQVQAQTLPVLLEAVSGHHPAIRAARESVQAADQAVEAAQGQYWPTLSAVLEAGSKSTESQPSQYLRLEQNLWDWGATGAGVDGARSGVRVAQMQELVQMQQIQLQVIEAWQAAHSARGRVFVAQSVASRLRDHEAMMARRVQAEASTSVELELIKAQVLQAQIERRRAQANFAAAVRRLEQLTGLNGVQEGLLAQPALPEPQASRERMTDLLRKSWREATAVQPQVLKADADIEQASLQVDLKQAQSRPQLYARVDRGIGSSGQTRGYVGLRYSLNTAMSHSSEIKSLQAHVVALQATRDATALEFEEQVHSDLSSLEENAQRFASLQQAVASSREIHASYVRQFVAGRKSWLDVMSAIRDVAQNEYALNDARHGYAGLLARLSLYEATATSAAP